MPGLFCKDQWRTVQQWNKDDVCEWDRPRLRQDRVQLLDETRTARGQQHTQAGVLRRLRGAGRLRAARSTATPTCCVCGTKIPQFTRSACAERTRAKQTRCARHGSATNASRGARANGPRDAGLCQSTPPPHATPTRGRGNHSAATPHISSSATWPVLPTSAGAMGIEN